MLCLRVILLKSRHAASKSRDNSGDSHAAESISRIHTAMHDRGSTTLQRTSQRAGHERVSRQRQVTVKTAKGFNHIGHGYPLNTSDSKKSRINTVSSVCGQSTVTNIGPDEERVRLEERRARHGAERLRLGLHTDAAPWGSHLAAARPAADDVLVRILIDFSIEKT